MNTKLDHKENIIFFEDDMNKKSSTKYISRFIFSLSNRVLITNLKKAIFIAIAFGLAISFAYQISIAIKNSIDNSNIKKNNRYTEFKQTIVAHPIEELNSILNMPIKKHEEAITEYIELYNKLSPEQKKTHDYDVQISPKSLSKSLSKTKENVAEIKKYLLPIYQYDNPGQFSYYGESEMLNNVEFFQAIKTGNFDFPYLMDDSYKNLLVKIEIIKNITALK